MNQEESFYRQREVASEASERMNNIPFASDYQYTGWQNEKITSGGHPHSLISRIVLTVFSVVAVLFAFQTTLVIHGILYDANVDPGSTTHLFINIMFVMLLFFIVLANILYNRKQK